MSACVFCRIVRGEIPSEKLCEDDDVLAFMDIGPLVKGHALVIPKAHFDSLTAVPIPLLGRMMAMAQRVARGMVDGLRAEGYNVHQANGACAGQVVPHVHFHVVPRFAGDAHSWNWKPKGYATGEMAAIAATIRDSLPG